MADKGTAILGFSLAFCLWSCSKATTIRGLTTNPPAIDFPTGDTRNVTEPTFPPSCVVLAAQLSVSGGEPSSETAFDTSRIQAQLNNCEPGSAVELAISGSNNAFLTQPLSIPSGVTLLIDAGVTLFASRNPADYQIGSVSGSQDACGTIGPHGNGCMPLITSTKTIGSGIMGYGVVNGRGGDSLIVDGAPSGTSWYDLTSQLGLKINHGMQQNNFKLVVGSEAANFTLYKITLKDSPFWTMLWEGKKGDPVTSGLTVWGVKILAPHNIENNDGIDPSNNVTNVTIADSFISNGDDMIALSAYTSGEPVSNVSITNVHTYAGLGISIGEFTIGGISNVLVRNLNQDGEFQDVTNSTQGIGGIQIKSSSDTGGLVQNVAYQNVCQQNESFAVRFASIPLYPPTSKPLPVTSIPSYRNIIVQNMTVLANPDGDAGYFNLQGYDTDHLETLTLDNVSVEGTPLFKADSDLVPAEENVAFNLGPGPVSQSLQQIAGPGISYAKNFTSSSESPYPCSIANFQPLTGELSASTASGNNLQNLTVPSASSITLSAVIQPAAEEYAVLTEPVTFYDGNTALGSVAIGGNGTLATLTLSVITPGTHVYTAQYPPYNNGLDPNPYPAFSFGSVTVIVTP